MKQKASNWRLTVGEIELLAQALRIAERKLSVNEVRTSLLARFEGSLGVQKQVKTVVNNADKKKKKGSSLHS